MDVEPRWTVLPCRYIRAGLSYNSDRTSHGKFVWSVNYTSSPALLYRQGRCSETQVLQKNVYLVSPVSMEAHWRLIQTEENKRTWSNVNEWSEPKPPVRMPQGLQWGDYKIVQNRAADVEAWRVLCEEKTAGSMPLSKRTWFIQRLKVWRVAAL